MDPKGANLASTDLLEISELVSGSYVTKSITGAEIVASVPPSVTAWGAITGTLSTQTDLQNALNAKVTGNTAITGATKTKVTYDSKGLVTAGADATTADIADSTNKRYVTDANLTTIGNTSGVNTGDQTLSGLGGVPTTRTLTINGTTQDLSADRTFTVSTGITIGTTAITSGTVGRVLFEGTGNVVQESANLFWDNTNNRLGLNTSTPTTSLSILRSGSANSFNFEPSATGTAPFISAFWSGAFDLRFNLRNGIVIGGLGIDAGLTIFNQSASANAGLIVGTLGVSGNASVGGGKFQLGSTTDNMLYFQQSGAAARGLVGYASGQSYMQVRVNGATDFATGTMSTAFFSTGNIGINTTTDAGFKLDVNGTARFNSSVTAQTVSSVNVLDVGSVRIADDSNGRYIQAVNGIILRATGTPTTNIITLSSNLANSWKSTQTILISPSSGNGGALFSSSATAGPSNTILTFTRQRNDAAKSAIINSEDFASSGNTPINLFIYAGKETVLNNQANLILCHDGTTARGNTLIGTTTNVASAIVNVESTTQGVLFPRLTTTQKNAIASPATGLMVYDTTLNLLALYNGTTWTTL